MKRKSTEKVLIKIEWTRLTNSTHRFFSSSSSSSLPLQFPKGESNIRSNEEKPRDREKSEFLMDSLLWIRDRWSRTIESISRRIQQHKSLSPSSHRSISWWIINYLSLTFSRQRIDDWSEMNFLFRHRRFWWIFNCHIDHSSTRSEKEIRMGVFDVW